MLDNSDLEQIMEKLESFDDQEMAVKLLKEFNDKSKKHGKLILNKDAQLEHDEWKRMCDSAQQDINEVVGRILSL